MFLINFIFSICLIPCIAYANLPLGLEEKASISQKNLSTWPEEPAEEFNPDLLYVLDIEKNVFLIRGNLPVHGHTFAYADLKKGIESVLAEKGVHIDEFKLLDVSFLNITEFKEIEIEKNWFKQHPETGKFLLNSLYGALINPVDLSEHVRHFILNNYDIDGLKILIPLLNQFVTTPVEENVVVYIHCMVGKDRTGEASACYLMQYKQYSYKESVALNQKIAKRKLRTLSMNAMRWYAFYLRDIQHCSWIGEID